MLDWVTLLFLLATSFWLLLPHLRLLISNVVKCHLTDSVPQQRRGRRRPLSRSWFRLLLDVLLLSMFLCLPLLYYVNSGRLFGHLLRSHLLNLDPSGHFYSVWSDNQSQPIYLNLTFFDVTNVAQLVPGAQGQGAQVPKMLVRETAPLLFRQYSRKSPPVFSADNRTLFYHESHIYILDPDRNDPSLLDAPLTVPNFPLLALLSQVERFNGVNNYMPLLPLIGGTLLDSYSVDAIDALLESSNESLFIQTTPRQLIFGYQMKLGAAINEFIDSITGNSTDGSSSSSPFTSWFRPRSSPSHKIGNFSLFTLFNGTLTGPFQLYTGLNGTGSALGQIRSYQGVDRFSLWKTEACNVINGSDLIIWNLDQVRQQTPLKAFIAGACRSVELQYSGPIQHQGNSLQRYTLAPGTFSSGATSCYCTNSNLNCSWTGLLDLSPCLDGIPLLFSKPYFTGAHPGMTHHRVTFTTPPLWASRPSALYIHPLLGLTLYGYANGQLSLRLSNDSSFGLLRSSLSAEYLVPFVHFTKEAALDAETANTLANLEYLHYGNQALTGIFTLFIVIAWAYFTGNLCYTQTREENSGDSDEEDEDFE